MSSVTTASGRLPFLLKALYGLGGMADSIKSVATGLYLLFFYTSVLGVPARLVGIAAALSLIWDASIDPVIGRWSDRTDGRMGRRHGWMAAGAPAVGVCFCGLFAPPAGLSTTGLFAWLLLMSLLLRAAHSAFAVPYLALGAELHPDYDERTSIAGFRTAAAQLGAVMASTVPLALFFHSASGSGSRLDPASYFSMALTLGGVMAIAALIATLGTWRYQQFRAGPRRDDTVGWRALSRNRAFILLTGSSSLVFLATVMSAVLSVYFLTYYVRIESGTILASCQLALYGGAIAAVPGWARLSTRYEKHRLFTASAVVTGGLVMAGFGLGGRLGALDGPLLAVLLVAYALTGAVSVGLWILPPSMLADVASEQQLRSGVRCEGALSGAFSCGHQIAAGLATVVGGLLLDHFAGVVPASATQSPSTIARVGILAALVPGTLMAVAGAIMLPYHLTRQRARDITDALAARAESVGTDLLRPSDLARPSLSAH